MLEATAVDDDAGDDVEIRENVHEDPNYAKKHKRNVFMCVHFIKFDTENFNFMPHTHTLLFTLRTRK